ncbi:hypothetical protein [Pseudoalteromonas sp. NBT06-2]|uniref:hypothetical protein n=1 Tax=Pseudoalteromonas sp. NBT06-2 TaxID=2025950 RepID=UPI00207586DB|nr:hypothetical protein [Pseudoalteromonas sp. NBT06-2]
MDVGTRAMQEHIAGPSFFKGVTINAKMRLDHELLSSPEPHILKWLGYITVSTINDTSVDQMSIVTIEYDVSTNW